MVRCVYLLNYRKNKTEKFNDKPVFLVSVHADSGPWYADLMIINPKVRFKIDTGPDVSVTPAQIYYCINLM